MGDGKQKPGEAAGLKSRHWSSVTEVGTALGLGFLYQVYRLFGRWPFRIALWPVLFYFVAFKGEQRRASMDFLRRCGLKPSAWLSFRHFSSFAESMLDKLIAWNGGIRLKDVDFEGREDVARRMAAGQGVMFIGSHLGNLEITRALSLERANFEIRVLVHTRHAENFNRLIHRLNPEARVNLQQVSTLGVGEAAGLSEALQHGESIIMAGDRSPIGGGRIVRAAFLGEEADFAQGPWVLAALLGAPVYLIFCLREGGRYRVIVEPFAEKISLPRGDRSEAIRALAEKYAARLEFHALSSPLQWFNFYSFWHKHEQNAA